MTLPHPLELAPFDVDAPAAMERLASVRGTCPLPEDTAAGSRSGRALKRTTSGALTVVLRDSDAGRAHCMGAADIARHQL